ncbi:MAG: hypothetical protein JW854_07160 [Actinobacteria bacterium]|nr:hypothetical protein [Actinomycetota bacterium]
MNSKKPVWIATVIACTMVSCLLLIPGCGQAEDIRGLQIEKLEVEIEADPENELLEMTSFLHMRIERSIEDCSFAFLQPSEITRVYDARSERELPYEINPYPGAGEGIYELSLDLSKCGEECIVALTYRYDGESFYAEGLNPTTNEGLVLGQITRDSIYSSHLFYYPYSGEARRASMRIVAPRGWIAVSSGELVTCEELQDGMTLYEYEIPFASGRLPYPLAIYPYEVTEALYDGRLPVSIYACQEDVPYSEEKMELVTGTILPFLEELMGEFPFEELRIVEVFPKTGMTGLATKSLVMLSQDTLFGEPIAGDYSVFPATVLVDEIAHQWNYYKVMFPNYLAEGISQYTSDLFTERYVDPDIMKERMATYREAYANVVGLLAALKSYKDNGETIEEVAERLGLSVEEVEAYWQYADYGEVPISDPNVYLSLYFLKGALAIDALRNELGDETFFAGFRSLFQEASEQEATLDHFEQCFESACGSSLGAFFQRWYYETGLPPQ